jgi:hypothetical protein
MARSHCEAARRRRQPEARVTASTRIGAVTRAEPARARDLVDHWQLSRLPLGVFSIDKYAFQNKSEPPGRAPSQ